jgi:hypothetical protein
LQRLRAVVKTAMEQGALGVASSLSEPPGVWIDTDTLVAMCEVAGQSGGHFLKGVTAAGASIHVGLPPLVAMFNTHGTAYAEGTIENRFVLWFNGNGIPERYWIPTETGAQYRMTPCLQPLAPFRKDIHIISGLDNAAAAIPGPGNGHHKSMSALMSCTAFTGRGTAGSSIDQAIAAKLGGEPRFRLSQIGVSPESLAKAFSAM